ncbi:hypothetical protein K438DRAFT_2026721 [Mycena galopus ATCC 62051]|nr:hypothetical protein K438DRAFT_2026721 [Mycena galopus ATCC 62051]
MLQAPPYLNLSNSRVSSPRVLQFLAVKYPQNSCDTSQTHWPRAPAPTGGSRPLELPVPLCDHRLWEGMCESGNSMFWVNPQVALEEHAPRTSLLIPIITERYTYLTIPPAPALSVPCWACSTGSMIAVTPWHSLLKVSQGCEMWVLWVPLASLCFSAEA